MKFTAFPRLLFNEAVVDPPAGPSAGPAAAVPPATPPAATPPAKPAIFNEDGTFAPNWHLAGGDEFSAHTETAERFKTPHDLLRSYTHLRATGPAYPTETSTPEEVARYRELAQVPAEPSGYGITKPENLPEGVTWDDAAVQRYTETAHKLGVPAPALAGLVALNLEIESARAAHYAQEAEKAKEAATTELVQLWGNDYQANLSTVRHLLGTLATQAGFTPAADGTLDPGLEAIANSPAGAKIIHAFSKLIGEDGVRAPAHRGDLRGPQQRADDIMAGTDTEWGKKYLEGDREAMLFVNNLMDQARGDG